jgi:hypothetical protein
LEVELMDPKGVERIFGRYETGMDGDDFDDDN